MTESTKNQTTLLGRLLLKSPDASEEEYNKFEGELLEYYFSRLLHIHTGPDLNTSTPDVRSSLSVENEIINLLSHGHPELFLSNIAYHLHRNGRWLPGALIPELCTLFKNQPEQWNLVYRLHPDLVLALASSHEEWTYMRSAFDPEYPLKPGDHQFYPSLRHRMGHFPIRTSEYIRKQFQEESVHHQARLLDVLTIGTLPENDSFIYAQVNHSRKEVRLVVLRYAILNKDNAIYKSLKKHLIYLLNQEKSRLEATSKSIKTLDSGLSWKDLSSLCEEHLPLSILMALIDPEDYKKSLQKHHWDTYHPLLWKSALFHHSQEVLSQMVVRDPELSEQVSLYAALVPETALRILRHLWIEKDRSFDSNFIVLLKIITPFLNEKDTDSIWAMFVRQWKELPFTLEDLDLEVLALRIHPNRIKPVWQHPLLQDTAPPLHKIREILKNRLEFLKKCYK